MSAAISVAFLGTPVFAVPVLEHLVRAGFDVRLTITQPDRPAGRGRAAVAPPVKLAAERLGLAVFQPDRLAEPAALARLRAAEVDAAVVAAYGEILTGETLGAARLGFLNVHPSLLPKWRGATPVPSAILAGDDLTGVTVMRVTQGVDSGPILAQVATPIEPDDTGELLLARLADLGADLLVDALPRWAAGDIEPRRQELLRATYSRVFRREDGRADWSRPAVELWRQCRAFQPWPGFFTAWAGRTLKIIECWPLPSRRGHPPGSVFQAGAEVAIAGGTGAIALRRLQVEGRRPLGIDEFLRGQPGFLGSRLGE